MSPRSGDKDPAKLPKNWSPEGDSDAQWEGIVRLLRESDQPTTPTDEQYDRLFTEVMEEVIGSEGAPAPAQQRRESFLDWLRLVLTGGGLPAHGFRFAAVATGALLIGMSLNTAPQQVATPQHHPGTARTVAMASPGNEKGPAGGGTIVPVSNDPSAGVASAAPASTVGRVIEREAWNTDERASANWDWEGTMASDQGWNFNQNMESYGSPQVVSSAPTAGASSRQQVISLMQQLKFQSMVERDEESLYQIRRLESALTPLLEDTQGVPNAEVEALDSFRRGEDLAARSRYADALLAFDQVRRHAPGTFMAFLAQFQIARIDFENLRDYESALEAYRVALEEYPSHFLSDENKALILQRIELLTRNSGDDWKALRVWQDALAAPDTASEISKLEMLLTESPTSPLASQAALRLAGLTLEDIRGEQINPLYVVRILDEAIAASPGAAHRADIQFAKGEVLLRRLLKLDEATEEFKQVVDNTTSEPIRLRALQRLRYLEERQSRVEN
ncbi:tetratricopeptide repeat protein [bacterium]|nr:tetratricopeptide repeat protein [bacterium]